MIIDLKEKFFDDVFTSKDLINQIQFGWNLRNSFDAFNDEYHGKSRNNLDIIRCFS